MNVETLNASTKSGVEGVIGVVLFVRRCIKNARLILDPLREHLRVF